MPSDQVDETIRALRNGDASDIDEGEDSAAGPAYGAPPVKLPSHSVAQELTDMPVVIRRVLASSAREELLGLANFLDPATRKKLTLIFHTPIGDVRTAVDWCSNKPDELMSGDNLLLIKVRTSESAFAPLPGADLEISFAEYAGRARVTCLAPPQRIYPGVDLLCFLPHNALMEKTGKLKENAPSVVSGLPSDSTNGDGEPVVEGEKSASLKAVTLKPAADDFDKPRV